MKKTVKLKLIAPLLGNKAESVIVVPSRGKIPAEKYWRDRLKDGGVVIFTNRKPKKDEGQ